MVKVAHSFGMGYLFNGALKEEASAPARIS
jgi:hypothetical protein